MVGYVLNLLQLHLLFHPFNLSFSQNIIKLVIILYINKGIGREARKQKNLIYNIVLFVAAAAAAAAATSFSYNPFTSAEPVTPDVEGCNKPTLPRGVEPLTCCPPNFEKKEPIDYVIPNYETLRIRRPAHDYDNLEKYKKAVNIMKSLPDDHPHSWTRQSRVHCAYSTNSYHQHGHTDVQMQVHFSWIFLPFHRWYLYFYERILGKLINDPNFAIPFWNWDAPQGMEIPAIFTNKSSPLYDARRNQNHQPPTLVDLNWNGDKIVWSKKKSGTYSVKLAMEDLGCTEQCDLQESCCPTTCNVIARSAIHMYKIWKLLKLTVYESASNCIASFEGRMDVQIDPRQTTAASQGSPR